MSVKRRLYILKNCSLAKLERVGRAYCKQCGVPLKSGDEVFTKPSTIRQQCAYHKKCAEQVNLL
jgi:hypothetical protein